MNFKINLSKRIKIFYLFIIFLFIALVANSFLFYQQKKESFYAIVDSKLKTVALNSTISFCNKFHEKVQQNKIISISDKENRDNALLLSKLTDKSDVKFVYTLIKKEDKVYFTCSSLTKKQQKENDSQLDFLLEYKGASKKLKDAFENNQSYYGEITDEYGSFRSILIPISLKNGGNYIVGADISISFIKKELKLYLFKLLFVEFLFLIMIVVFIILYIKSYKQETKVNEKKEKALREQSKLASMGEMLQNIAHQWRQPLSEINAVVMKIDADFYKKRLNAETLEKDIQRVENITNHMSNTIESFNSYFKQNQELNITTLEAIIKKALNIMDGSLKDIEVDLTIEDNSKIEINSNKFIQVILIILNNAVDALALNNIKDKTITIRIKKLNENFILEIEDNAGGITEENLNKIFEPYFTTKFKADGIGIGLYMAKTLIEDNLKGTLSVSNSKNGAKFKIIL